MNIADGSKGQMVEAIYKSSGLLNNPKEFLEIGLTNKFVFFFFFFFSLMTGLELFIDAALVCTPLS